MVQPTVKQITDKIMEWASGDPRTGTATSLVNSARASPLPIRPDSPVCKDSSVREESPVRIRTPVQAETDVLYQSESLLRPISPLRSNSPVNPDRPIRSASPVLVMTASGPEVINPDLHFENLERNSSKTEIDRCEMPARKVPDTKLPEEKFEKFSSKNLLVEWNRNVILLIKVRCKRFSVLFDTASPGLDTDYSTAPSPVMAQLTLSLFECSLHKFECLQLNRFRKWTARCTVICPIVNRTMLQ